MAIDRGELRYKITLRTGKTFTALKKFRTELAESRTAFAAFRTELRAGGRDATVAARGITQTATALEGLQGSRRGSQALAQQIQDARKARRAFGRIVSELKQIRRELGNVQKASQGAGRAMQQAGRQGQTAGKKATTGFKRLQGQIKRTRSGADRLAGSFLRMGGIIATFIVARSVLDGLRNLISASIQFNRTIEIAQLGIAAILTAVGELRGTFGQVVSQAEQLALAQAEARKQTQLLRRDALTTAATFEQLLQTFQVALAPGLTAGLDVDEVRGFALRISQAALALGVAQNQLSEEVRAILSGVIRPQTTRIATALGITNEDIKKVREMGTLAEFLEVRFAAFGEAGKFALQTVEGLVGRVIDGFSQLAGSAGETIGFFDQIKSTLQDLLNLFLDFDEFGFPVPDPKTLAVLQVLFQGISEAFESLRDQAAAVTFEEAIQAARTLSRVIVGAVQVISGVIRGIVDGFLFLGTVIQQVADALGFDKGKQSLQDIVRRIASILVVLIAFRASLGIVFGLIAPIVGAFSGLFTVIGSVGRVLRRMIPSLTTIRNGFATVTTSVKGLLASLGKFGPILLRVLGVVARLAGGFLLVVGGVNLVIRAVTGIELSFSETITAIQLSFEILFIRITSGLKLLGGEILNLGGLLDTIDTQGIAAQQTEDLDKVKEAFADLEKANRKRILDEADAVAKAKKAAKDRAKAENDAATAAILSAASIVDGLGLQVEAVKTLLQTLDEVTAQFSVVGTAIQSVAGSVDRLRVGLETFDLSDQFEIDPAVTGVAAQIQVAAQREQITLGRELISIERNREQIAQNLVQATQASADAQRRLIGFSTFEQQIVAEVDQTLRRIIGLRKEEAALLTAGGIALLEQRNAADEGDTAGVVAAKARRQQILSQLEATKFVKDELEKQLEIIKDSTVLSGEFKGFIEERIVALSKEASLSRDLLNIEEAITSLQRDSTRLQIQQAEQLAARGLRDAENRIALLRVETSLRADLNDIQARAGATGAASQLRQLQAQSQELRLQGLFTAQKLLTNIQALQVNIDAAKIEGLSTTNLEAQKAVLQEQVGLQAQLNVEARERLEIEQERARILAEGTTGEAINLGAQDFIDQIGTIQEQIAQLTTDLLQTLASGLSNALVSSIVTAFEKTEDETRSFFVRFRDNLVLALGQILQSIAQQLLQTLINNLISSLLQSIVTTTATQITAATTAATIEAASAQLSATTKITAATTAASIEIAAAQTAAAIKAVSGGLTGLAVSRGGLIPQHFAEGGLSKGPKRPAGVPQSDTVPAWLTPGEFVQRVSAVRHYGVDVMRALNRRLIDPQLLRGLAGVKAIKSFTTQTSRGPGFADGGVVSENIRQVTANLEAEAGERVAQDVPPTVAFAVNDNTMETILSSGREAFRRFLRENASDFDGILRGGRTGG